MVFLFSLSASSNVQTKTGVASTIGIEYHHIPSRQQCDWIRQRLEVPQKFKYTQQEKKMILDRLIWSDSFERFVAAKWTSEKRFGLEGCEALIPGMKALVRLLLIWRVLT